MFQTFVPPKIWTSPWLDLEPRLNQWIYHHQIMSQWYVLENNQKIGCPTLQTHMASLEILTKHKFRTQKSWHMTTLDDLHVIKPRNLSIPDHVPMLCVGKQSKDRLSNASNSHGITRNFDKTWLRTQKSWHMTTLDDLHVIKPRNLWYQIMSQWYVLENNSKDRLSDASNSHGITRNFDKTWLRTQKSWHMTTLDDLHVIKPRNLWYQIMSQWYVLENIQKIGCPTLQTHMASLEILTKTWLRTQKSWHMTTLDDLHVIKPRNLWYQIMSQWYVLENNQKIGCPTLQTHMASLEILTKHDSAPKNHDTWLL